MTHSSVSGKPIEMFDAEDMQHVFHGAHENFIDCCKERGLTGEALQSPFAPLLLEKAYDVALLQAAAKPVRRKGEAGFADTIAMQQTLKNRQAAQERKDDIATHNKAVALLRETVNTLPRDTDRRGRKLKPALDTAEKVLQVFDTLEQTRMLLDAPRTGRAC